METGGAKNHFMNIHTKDKNVVFEEIFSKLAINFNKRTKEISTWAMACGDEIKRER